ncbi:F-actin-monooxygenase mical2b isoform X6 [Ctenopharyngodon idella]|uniref:F-actin-monooxygenase mical2b isoform X6 n=1 Tax=Ctenopharyngodon idella TaxID=7959 RepID=UPI00223003C0|nr:F-actin-monooxygenase mical2b isoform X6 [Ctenopharyngodon idella]
MGETEDERTSQAGQLFENFVQATTCKGTLQAFSVLCRQLELNPSDHRGFYSSLKAAITYWKAKGLWGKLDKRASHKEYNKGKACADTRCLIIGGGPCGFRTAIELALLGAKVVVIEKRDTFSRNNVLHLWPYTIHDLRNLGAKKFYGKFCAGSIDHISIRQLQLMLLKIALIVGVEVHVNVEFVKLLEPPEDQGTDGPGWRMEIRPADHPISDYEFDVIVGADGRRSTLDGFKRKEFRGKLAIAITANFVNRNTTAEAKVEEISGVAFIFNQKFFLELKEETGIDLENIVYYRDNTHYFVMTAKKQSLLDKGVIINDYIETERLLANDNVNQEALLSYAREAADFGTNYQLPSLDYAINHYGQPDVAMFDFTCMYASENAALVREKSGHQLLVALVGDSLLEPFWPMGTGCARGFLAAFDTVWMVRGWAQGKGPLDLLSERESIYRLLPQTTAENISKNFEQYTIDPATRYPNLNSSCVRPHQVRHLYINGEQDLSSLERSGPTRKSANISRRESEVRPSRLLLWCQKQTQGYRGVDVTDLTTSWRSGLALCALIHRQRPDLIDFNSLNEADCAKNNQLAFDVAEREFGIQPVTTGKEMDAERGPDKLIMVLYLSKFYEMFRNSTQSNTGVPKETDANNEDYSSKTANSLYNSINNALPRKRIPKVDKKLEDNDTNKKRKKASSHLEELMSNQSAPPVGEREEQKENKVRSMATQLLARFEENAPSSGLRRQRTVGKVSSAIGVKAATLAILYETDHRPNNPFTLSLTNVRKEFPPGLGGSDTCHFCKKRVYIMERLSAEGYFFHRECFRCNTCSCTLRLGAHAFDSNQGTFYCKLHFSQRKISSRHRRGEINGGSRPLSSASTDYTATDGLRGQPSGAESDSRTQNPPKCLSDPSAPAESPEVQALSDSTELINMSEVKDSSKKPDPADSAPACPDSPQQKVKRSTAKGEITNKNNLWRKKIRSTLPLVLLKKFHRGKPDDKTEALGKDDGDSDFEEIHESLSPTKPATQTTESDCPLMEDKYSTPLDEIPKIPLYRSHFHPETSKPSTSSPEPVVTAVPSEAKSFSPKKKLTLSLSEKEKLLNWDLTAPGKSSTSEGEQPDRTSTNPQKDQPEPEAPPKPSRPQPEPTPPLFGFQQWANSLRKSFSKGSNPVVLRRNRPLKARPLSEGSFNLSGLLGSSIRINQDEEHSSMSTDESQSRTRTGSELTTLLEQVALSSKTPKGAKDDMASLPPRKLNFFSSLRIKRNEGADKSIGDNEKDILTILSRFRSKASAQQQQQQESNSSSEEEQEPDSQRTHSGTSQKKKEKTAVQQTKRDQLKRLHRAQVIQRQLEEVEEKQRALEEKGVALEKVLRGETGDDSTDETALLQTWFKLVLEKNKLSRYEAELMIFAQELELEDTQSRLQQDMRRRMDTEDCKKSASELVEEQSLLVEIMKVVEKRDKLVSLLEEQRLKEKAEDRDLESMILSRGYQFHWT